MQRLRNLAHIMRITRADKLFVSYLGLFFVIAALITLVEPDIKTYGEGVWYCYTMSATIGFGDMVAVTIVGRILTIFLSLCSILIIGMIPAIIVSYYMTALKRINNEAMVTFMEKLERLPELSEEELKDISAQVKKMRLRM